MRGREDEDEDGDIRVSSRCTFSIAMNVVGAAGGDDDDDERDLTHTPKLEAGRSREMIRRGGGCWGR